MEAADYLWVSFICSLPSSATANPNLMEKEAELLQSLTESFVAVGLSLLTCLLSLFLPSSHQLCPSCLLCVTRGWRVVDPNHSYRATASGSSPGVSYELCLDSQVLEIRLVRSRNLCS